MWFRYNASGSGVMVPPLGSGGAADRRVTNHDGWEFNGLPTIHTPGLDRNKLCGWRGGQPWWRKREGFWLFPCLFFSDTDKILNQNTNLWWLNDWWDKYGSVIQSPRSPGCLQHLFYVKLTFSFTHTSFQHFCILTLILGKCRSEYEKGGRDANMQGACADTRSVAWEGIKAMKG